MHYRPGYLARVIVGALVAVIGVIFGVTSLLDATGARHQAGSTTRFAVLAVLFLVIAAAGAVLASHAEHQLHQHRIHGPAIGPVTYPVARVPRLGGGTGTVRLLAGRRRSAHAPVVFAVQALVGIGITIFCLFTTLSAHADADRSAYTQQHGVSETAVADNVQNIASATKHGTTYTNQITVTVRHPKIGTGSATVYGQGMTSVQQGDTVTVLIDPRQPAYAEIPGAPFTTTSGWVMSLIITIVFGLVSILVTRVAVVMILRHRRGSLGQPSAAGA